MSAKPNASGNAPPTGALADETMSRLRLGNWLSLSWGAVQLIAAGVLIVVAAGFTWSGIQRWRAGNALDHATVLRLGGNRSAAQMSARDARDLMPSSPATVLAAGDLASAETAPELDFLAQRCPAPDRAAVGAARGINALLLGKPLPDGIPDADLAWLKAAAADTPKLPTGDDQPFAATMHVALPRLLATAWRTGDRVLVREAAGALILLMPRHPQRDELQLVLAALDARWDKARLLQVARSVSDAPRREMILGRVAVMAPDRAEVIASVAASGTVAGRLPTGAAVGDPLALRVGNAASRPAAERETLARHCLELGRADLARQLNDGLPQESQARLRVALLSGEGRLLQLADDQKPEHQPRVSVPVNDQGLLSFHLSNRLGTVPTDPVVVRVDGVPVAPSDISRQGTLVVAILPPKAGVAPMIQILLGTKPVFSGEVRP